MPKIHPKNSSLYGRYGRIHKVTTVRKERFLVAYNKCIVEYMTIEIKENRNGLHKIVGGYDIVYSVIELNNDLDKELDNLNLQSLQEIDETQIYNDCEWNENTD